ncbi:hypothetical protein AWC11_20570 [Mycobacterium interjectum]|nr:hypothetical protein AWC11_20570 [Mycobacterium interjectum]
MLAAASLAVAAVAVTVAALLVIPRIGGGSSHSAQPGGPQQDAARQAGQRYLEALARGDAAGALAVSANPPATTQFLTADVLRAQLAAAPITAVTVTPAPAAPGDDPADVQYVMLSAKFGPTLSQARVGVHRNGDEWKLDGGTVAVDIGSPGSNNASLKAVALWGVATNGASPVAVFPGALAVSSSNPNIDITAQAQPVLLDGLTGAADRPTIQPVATLNDVGRQAVKMALDSWTRHCFRGVAPPPDCSTLDTGNNTVVVDGGGDFSKVTFAFDPNTMAVTTSGPIVYHGRAAGIADYTVSSVPIGTVDLTKEPPVFVRTARG